MEVSMNILPRIAFLPGMTARAAAGRFQKPRIARKISTSLDKTGLGLCLQAPAIQELSEAYTPKLTEAIHLKRAAKIERVLADFISGFCDATSIVPPHLKLDIAHADAIGSLVPETWTLGHPAIFTHKFMDAARQASITIGSTSHELGHTYNRFISRVYLNNLLTSFGKKTLTPDFCSYSMPEIPEHVRCQDTFTERALSAEETAACEKLLIINQRPDTRELTIDWNGYLDEASCYSLQNIGMGKLTAEEKSEAMLFLSHIQYHFLMNGLSFSGLSKITTENLVLTFEFTDDRDPVTINMEELLSKAPPFQLMFKPE
jgi:hypothetical protein